MKVGCFETISASSSDIAGFGSLQWANRNFQYRPIGRWNAYPFKISYRVEVLIFLGWTMENIVEPAWTLRVDKPSCTVDEFI